MAYRHHPFKKYLIAILLPLLAAACGSNEPTGIATDDVRGTWSGTFADFSLMGRTLTGDLDWTFSRETFEIIFFNPPAEQAERIQGKWKFTDGRIAIELTSSFPIDNDIGARDTLFVSILRDEMSLKTIAQSSTLLIKTRVASTQASPKPNPEKALWAAVVDAAAGRTSTESPKHSDYLRSSEHRRADIRQHTRTQHPPI